MIGLVRIAYIISAYKYPDQLIRLVRRLQTEHTFFFVHVDKKTPDALYRSMVNGLHSVARVTFLPRHACNWGGFGHVLVTLKAIDAIVGTETSVDYAILLTGQDYPIKPNAEIQAFLQAHTGTSFMDYFSLPCSVWERQGLDRIRYWHFRLLGRHITLPVKRRFPTGFVPYGGSSYWCLTGSCFAYLWHFMQTNPSFVRFFRHVDVPDELFFQTVLLNSELRSTIVNDDLRYIDWKDPDAGSPAVLDESDFDKIRHSPKLFARKFDMTVAPTILDRIDREILLSTPATTEEIAGSPLAVSGTGRPVAKK